MASSRPLVFLGPTLSAEEAGRVLPAVYLPPAAQGAIVSSVQRYKPPAILLIDGVFQGEPAVRHKEILWAISRGIQVYGAASMGALRAAELWRHGMIGIGLIFRWYRRFPLLPDDAVAVLHGPREVGSHALTHGLVDLRITVRRAERAGLIDRALRMKLEREAAALNFRDRTLNGMVERALGDALDDSRRRKVIDELASCFVSQKRADALAALRFLQDIDLLRGSPLPPAKFVTTTAFLHDLHHAGIDLA